jgi:hypothetical protein
MRRTDERDRFPFVPAINAEIFAVYCDDAVARVQLAHADEAKIGEIWVAIALAACQGCELGQMVLAVESKGNQSVSNHRENERDVAQVKCGFCQNGFASQ